MLRVISTMLQKLTLIILLAVLSFKNVFAVRKCVYSQSKTLTIFKSKHLAKAVDIAIHLGSKYRIHLAEYGKAASEEVPFNDVRFLSTKHAANVIDKPKETAIEPLLNSLMTNSIGVQLVLIQDVHFNRIQTPIFTDNNRTVFAICFHSNWSQTNLCAAKYAIHLSYAYSFNGDLHHLEDILNMIFCDYMFCKKPIIANCDTTTSCKRYVLCLH